LKTCELNGCTNKVKTIANRFCCYEHFNIHRTVSSFDMVKKCKGCSTKMKDSDKFQHYTNSAYSKYCKACRDDKKVDSVAEKIDSRKSFVARFNSMNFKKEMIVKKG